MVCKVCKKEFNKDWRVEQKPSSGECFYCCRECSRRASSLSKKGKPGKKHSEETKKKLSTISSLRKQSEETKKKLSNIIKEKYKTGWMPKAGRCKKILYESVMAGTVFLDGTWEYKVALFLDEHKLHWLRNTKKFDYIFNGKDRKYTPDFFVEEWNSYLEIKGYETELDRAKWSQFSENLIIWKKKDLLDRHILESGQDGNAPDC